MDRYGFIVTDKRNLTINELMGVLKEAKAHCGGNARVIFEEPVKLGLCDITSARVIWATGSGSNIESYDEDEAPDNAEACLCLINYD